MKIYSIILIIIALITTAVSVDAKSSVLMDNWDIQSYRGKLGIWKLVKSRSDLKYHSGRYKASIEEIKRLNSNRIWYGKHLFMPYSAEFIKNLKSKGKIRNMVMSKNDEFIWPVEGIDRITSTFKRRMGKFHYGIDLPKRKGTPVVASMDGKVVSIGYSGGYGNTIVIECRNNIITKYSHNSVLLLKKGDLVRKGQVIAFLGSTGNSTGNHLHFEIRYKDIPLNPLDFLPPKKDLKFGMVRKK